MNNNDLQAAYYHLTRTDFRYYLRSVFTTLNPQTQFKSNWHIDYLCYLLSRTLPRHLNPEPDSPRLKRIIINIPPRYLKSEITSVGLRTFIHGHMPHERVMSASYAARLSKKFNLASAKVIKSDWYQACFPGTILTKDTEAMYETSQNGLSFATSTEGTATGEGGNYLIVDDILNPEQARSDVERVRANEFFTSTLLQRMNDPEEAVIIIIMQRLHEDDLTGFLLEQNKELPEDQHWLHVNLPAIAQKDEEAFHYYGKTHIRYKGDVLHPERQSESLLTAKRIQLGAYNFAAQYQQEPAPAEGGLLKFSDFRLYAALPTHTAPVIYQSWDTSIKTLAHHDFSVCTTWAVYPEGFYLTDIFMDKLEYPQLKEAISLQYAKYNPAAVLIEDKGSGQQLCQDFRQLTTIPVIPIVPYKDKVQRAATVSPLLESGNVFIPENFTTHKHFDDFMSQINFFPNGKHDDIVDSITQFLNYIKFNAASRARVRKLG